MLTSLSATLGVRGAGQSSWRFACNSASSWENENDGQAQQGQDLFCVGFLIPKNPLKHRFLFCLSFQRTSACAVHLASTHWINRGSSIWTWQSAVLVVPGLLWQLHWLGGVALPASVGATSHCPALSTFP